MPLPDPKSSWPPAGNGRRYDRMRKSAAWYSGQRGDLVSAYGYGQPQVVGGPATTLNQQGVVKRVIGAIRNEFWSAATIADGETDTRRHLPLAQDIAKLSSEWLFSEPVKVIVDGPTHADDGPETGAKDDQGEPILEWRKGDPMPETQAAQQYLDARLDAIGWDSLLLAGAEIASALGSMGLRIAFDKAATPDGPIIARADADTYVPQYRWGQLTGVLFWAVVKADAGDTIWRHVELHEAGMIWHALYKGDSDNIGERMPLREVAATAPLEAITNPLGQVLNADGSPLVLPGRTATSIPNMLPDPADRQSGAGRSDYTDPVMDLLDAADRIYTQLLDSIEEGRGMTFLADSMLKSNGVGEGVSFNRNQRTFTKLKVPPAEKEGGQLPIERVQFEMHISELLEALSAIMAMAIRAAGYNPDTDGSENTPEMTATEYTGKTKRSLTTRDKKIRYQEPELATILTTYLAVAVEQYAPRWQVGEASLPVQAFPVRVQFPDAVQPSMIELANVAKALKDAGAASVETLVRTVHPDWDEGAVAAEADRIIGAASVVDPVSFGTGGAGMGAGDGV